MRALADRADIDARDEAFWRKQEARREKKMGQPCCTQSGMSWSMIDMPGDFAVVIHGEFDCVNCFHHHVGRSAANYYSTRLTEAQITNGETQEPLRRCLRLIAKERKPEAVIVLGTCPVEVIGDRFETVVEQVAKETSIPMVPLHTSGLAMLSQTRMLDWLYDTLAALPAGEPVDRSWQRETGLVALDALFRGARREHVTAIARKEPTPLARRLNLVGLPESDGVPEPVAIAGALGLEVNGVYPFGASSSEWRAIRHAAAAFMVDASMLPRLRRRLESFGQAIVDLPMPVGLGPTRACYADIAKTFGVEGELDRVLADRIAPIEAAIARSKSRIGGTRMAVAIRMLNTYRADQLAFEGLGDLGALVEAGLDVTLLVQGPPEEASRAAFAKSLSARGITLPFEIFAGPFAFGEALQRGRYDVCYASDSSRQAARDAGVPMISARGLAPYLEGVVPNLELLARLVGEARR